MKLAKLTNDEPKVLRVDCSVEHEICDIYKNHIDKVFPQLVLVTKERVYSYGVSDSNYHPIVAQDVLASFIQNQNYKNFPVHGGSGTPTRELIRRGHDYVQTIIE